MSAGAEIGANGLLGRKGIGKGVAVFCQVDPDRFRADERTYFRYNMSLRPKPVGVQALGYYHPDYRTDFSMGDNPYRYYRW